MPRTCTVCRHGERAELDAALVAGEPFRDIARRYATTKDALRRHKAEHLPAAIVKAKEAKDVANGDTLLRQIRDLQRATLGILTTAEKDDPRTALGAIHQARENLAFLSKLTADLKPLSLTPEMAAKMSDEELDAALVKMGVPSVTLDVKRAVHAAYRAVTAQREEPRQ